VHFSADVFQVMLYLQTQLSELFRPRLKLSMLQLRKHPPTCPDKYVRVLVELSILFNEVASFRLSMTANTNPF
jgi:hypothetical protein